MKKPKIKWPPPGTLEAQGKGCLCPEKDNAYGKGVEAGGMGVSYWIRTDCPLHGSITKGRLKDD